MYINTYKYIFIIQKAPYIRKECRAVVTTTQNSFNCWKFLKLTKLQHNYEIRVSVNVAKAEKIS